MAGLALPSGVSWAVSLAAFDSAKRWLPFALEVAAHSITLAAIKFATGHMDNDLCSELDVMCWQDFALSVLPEVPEAKSEGRSEISLKPIERGSEDDGTFPVGFQNDHAATPIEASPQDVAVRSDVSVSEDQLVGLQVSKASALHLCHESPAMAGEDLRSSGSNPSPEAIRTREFCDGGELSPPDFAGESLLDASVPDLVNQSSQAPATEKLCNSPTVSEESPEDITSELPAMVPKVSKVVIRMQQRCDVSEATPPDFVVESSGAIAVDEQGIRSNTVFLGSEPTSFDGTSESMQVSVTEEHCVGSSTLPMVSSDFCSESDAVFGEEIGVRSSDAVMTGFAAEAFAEGDTQWEFIPEFCIEAYAVDSDWGVGP